MPSRTGTVTFDLRSGLLDVLNRAAVFAKLKYAYIELSAPTAGDVWFGPQTQTNDLACWFDSAGGTGRQRVRDRLLMIEPSGFTRYWRCSTTRGPT
ncbi:hypothetical protein [Limnoglobus roseus]|uniref:Uncharacterized protein n=1 Tax=Limnoglobus roseus TaxID=2598579 RepID=A0A5C1AAM1_9BACT|nr:hypothetical protein [Limnoglobus roseus]QEL15615.1 hypothetical protein PX52LOC_02548 [Limnoglobus roseus]